MRKFGSNFASEASRPQRTQIFPKCGLGGNLKFFGYGPSHDLNQNLDSLECSRNTAGSSQVPILGTPITAAQATDFTKTTGRGVAPKPDGDDHFSIAFRVQLQLSMWGSSKD